jgi:septum formation protein
VSPGAPALVLASASPRRRALLSGAGLCFEVVPAGVDETLAPGTPAEDGARLLAERKARAVAARRGVGWVLGADTLVVLDRPAGEELLGKPAHPDEARAMLRALSGSRHRVITGLCVLRCFDGIPYTDAETTWVTMRPLLPAEIEEYVESGEWRDKAGGYAIQERAERFVTALEGGGFDNVVGLPVQRTLALLGRAGAGPRALGL